jgi:hypothetical protein
VINELLEREQLVSCSVDREITESSEVQQLRVELYRVYGSDYRISNCDTADGSNCEIVNCVIVRASVQ